MSEWKGKYEDWRIDWVTYGGPYICYPAWPHPENGHSIAKLTFADPTPFEGKRQRASLIAAAPDMYEALAAMVGLDQDGLIFSSSDAHAQFVVDQARAALAKALGPHGSPADIKTSGEGS